MLTTRDLNDIAWALKDLIFRLGERSNEFQNEILIYENIQTKIHKIIRDLADLEYKGMAYGQLAVRLEIEPPKVNVLNKFTTTD